ncbi:MAG: hypothetical protein KGP10_07495 [Actinomycetales bacterium]|nr:hypothetical protein [Actinomycetales bacterium]
MGDEFPPLSWRARLEREVSRRQWPAAAGAGVLMAAAYRRGRPRSPLPETARRALEAVLPVDPLCEGDPSPLDVLILIGPRDRDLAGIVAAAAVAAVGPALSRLRILTPQRYLDEVAERVASVVSAAGCSTVGYAGGGYAARGHAAGGHEVISDEASPAEPLLGLVDAAGSVDDHGPHRAVTPLPPQRRGWVRQQVLKIGAVALAPDPTPTLVVDADTILLRPRTWLVGTRQLLSISHEFTCEYARHAERVLGRRAEHPYSFVTHHQLWQPDLLLGMLAAGVSPLPALNDLRGRRQVVMAGVRAWLTAADWGSGGSAVSEYHSYGAWAAADPSRIALAGWRNLAVPRSSVADILGDHRNAAARRPADGTLSAALSRLRERFPDAASISCHHYLG